MTDFIDELKDFQIKQDLSPAPFQASQHIWAILRKQFDECIKTTGISSSPEEQFYNKYFSAREPSHKCYDEYAKHIAGQLNWKNIKQSAYEYCCHSLLHHISIYYVGRSILEGTRPTKSHTIVLDTYAGQKKEVSWDYLMSVASLMTMVKHVPKLLSDDCTVLDLGGGWGRIGHVLLQINSKARYIDLDLPEPLMVAKQKLCHEFPHLKNNMTFNIPEHLLTLDDSSIDVLVSINSMQEMSPGDHNRYLEIIGRKAKNMYLLAHENVHNGHKKEFISYEWPVSWKQKHFKKEVYWWPGFFEVVYGI